jgi:hypothetical protein
MSTRLGAVQWDGPYFDFDALCDEPGILAILSHKDGTFHTLELVDANHVREYIQLHPKLDSWYERNAEPAVAVCYTPDLRPGERQEILKAMQAQLFMGSAA